MSTPAGPAVSPVRVEGNLDAKLSRWLWLVKWILVIPHWIVLAFLWIGFFFTSVVAFFAILFTTRYPRGLFDYGVGVLRWTWRVGFYSYSALGTDRYPRFSLADDPDYPARLDVSCPYHPPSPGAPGAPRRPLPRAAPLARPRAHQVVAAPDPSLHRRRGLRRRWGDCR